MPNRPPEFLVVGHVTRDVGADGSWRSGGAALYAAATARALGLRTAVLTRAASPDDLRAFPGSIDIECLESEETTQFVNTYAGHERRQKVLSVAGGIAASDMPERFRGAGAVLLGPVFNEVDHEIVSAVDGLVGLGVQGWLRDRDDEGSVTYRRRQFAGLLDGVASIFASTEDAPDDELELLRETWRASVPMVAVTAGPSGGELYFQDDSILIPTFPALQVDPSGAGDVFAAAFLARYAETSDPYETVEFAAAAAACSVEGVGISRIPGRAAIAARREVGHG